MSEGAYRDPAIRNQLKGEHEALSIRPGAEFELSSYKLVLRGTVEKLEYVEPRAGEHGVFGFADPAPGVQKGVKIGRWILEAGRPYWRLPASNFSFGSDTRLGVE